MAETERRRYPRVSIARPVKMQVLAGGRYLAGRTCDVSAGGALISMGQAAHVVAGQRLRVGISGDEGQAVMASSEMFDAKVLRVQQADPIAVAVQFDQPQAALATLAA